MIRVRWMAISFVMRQRCFRHIGMFSFLHRECVNLHEGYLRNKMHFTLHFERVVFCVKLFWPITRVKNNSQEKFTILHVPHIGFFCYSNWDQILLYGRWLESKDEYMYCFMKFFNLSTDNRKVSTFYAFQHVCCCCCYRSPLDRFLIILYKYLSFVVYCCS